MTATGEPAVSVVLPTRNCAHVLPRAVESMLAQTFTDFELLVIDDGSTDETSEIRARFTDPRIVWTDGPYAGVSVARNLGISRARGSWVAFLDDDNEWLPRCLERQVATARATGADVVSCLATEERTDGTPRRQPSPPSRDPVVALTRDWCPLTSCVLARRDAVVAAGLVCARRCGSSGATGAGTSTGRRWRAPAPRGDAPRGTPWSRSRRRCLVLRRRSHA